MKKLFDSADEYVRQSDWLDLAGLKLCLAAIGMLIGVHIPKKHKDAAVTLARWLFALTFPPLMGKYIRILLKKPEDA